jgi:hypothetical protein
VWTTTHVEQPGVYCSELEVALVVGLLDLLDVVQEPAQLNAAEIRRERQPGLFSEGVYAMLGLASKLPDGMSCAGVGPDDDVVERLSRALVPDDGRFALVGDAWSRPSLSAMQFPDTVCGIGRTDGLDVASLVAGCLELLDSLVDAGLYALQELLWPLFHPSGLGVY